MCLLRFRVSRIATLSIMLVLVKHYLSLALLLLICACSRPETESRDTRPVRSATPATAAPATDSRKVLVVFGDSLSAGYGLDPGESFPDALQRRLDAEKLPWRVVNLGISGDTTAGGAARISSAVSLSPALILLELGGNDGLRGVPISSTRANLEAMIQAFQKAGARVVLAGMTLPPNYGPDYIRDFEGVYKELAAKYKLPLIPFLLSDIITADLRYLQRDGIHPTAEGAEIVAGTVLKALRPELE
jgi:acyl-CoA thioesterase-1